MILLNAHKGMAGHKAANQSLVSTHKGFPFNSLLAKGTLPDKSALL
jgi:hypothetical protein